MQSSATRRPLVPGRGETRERFDTLPRSGCTRPHGPRRRAYDPAYEALAGVARLRAGRAARDRPRHRHRGAARALAVLALPDVRAGGEEEAAGAAFAVRD